VCRRAGSHLACVRILHQGMAPLSQPYLTAPVGYPQCAHMHVLITICPACSPPCQASHDAHTSRVDALEDRLVSTELRSANDLTGTNALWAARRNRDRISGGGVCNCGARHSLCSWPPLKALLLSMVGARKIVCPHLRRGLESEQYIAEEPLLHCLATAESYVCLYTLTASVPHSKGALMDSSYPG
jgi:hypothetical protein